MYFLAIPVLLALTAPTCVPSRASLCVILASGRSVSVTSKNPGPDFPLQGEVTDVHRGKVGLRASTFSAKPVVVAFSSALGNQTALVPGHRVSFDFHRGQEGSPASVRVDDLEEPSSESSSDLSPAHAAPAHAVTHTTARAVASHQRAARHAAAPPASEPASQPQAEPESQSEQPKPPSEIQRLIAASPWCDSLVEGSAQSSAAPYTGKTCKVRDRYSRMPLLAWVADQDLERKEKHLPRLLCATPPSMQGGRRHVPSSIPCSEISEIKDESSPMLPGGQ